jgi:hypothetical protein
VKMLMIEAQRRSDAKWLYDAMLLEERVERKEEVRGAGDSRETGG